MLYVDGYVRVSRVGYRSGERFISPSVQREQLEAWARARPATLLEVWEELDESGGRRDRPLLESAVGRIERGLSQGLVVANVDRFGRSLLHGLAMIDRIERAGGTFVSVGDGFDISTDAGRLVLRIMLAMAEWQLDRTRAWWKTAVARAIARGVFVGSAVPVGYRKTRAGRLRVVPETAEVVREVFERRAGGEQLASLGRLLEQRGVLTGWGNPGWHRCTLTNLLHNRVYRGELHWGHHVKTDAHEAIVDEPTWQAAQKPTWRASTRNRSPALLAGLVRCMSCGRMMGKLPRADGVFDYECRVKSAAGVCPAPARIAGTFLEICVQDVALDMLDRRRRPPNLAVEHAEAKVAAAQNALTAYRDSQRVLTLLGEQAYADGLAARVEKLRAAALALDSARRHRAAHHLPPGRDVEARWPDMSLDERRSVLDHLIECVFVGPGHRHYSDRVWICPKGTRLSGLPHHGNRDAKLRAFSPGRGWISANYQTSRPRRWSRARLERELRDFVQDRTRWPTPANFESAGRARLYRQMELQGGARYWARHFGLPMPKSRTVHWADERIREALIPYLKDKEAWPTAARFNVDGQSTLRAAISSSGGARRWALEFGVNPQYENCHGPIPYWTEDRVREQIDEFCQGRTTFPRREELRLTGPSGLGAAMSRFRGLDYWQRRSGLPYAPPRRPLRGPPPPRPVPIAKRKSSR